jgi:hypothetical protein
MVPVPTKRTAGAEFLGTIEAVPIDYFGLAPHANDTASAADDRNILVTLVYGQQQAGGYVQTRIKVAGLNPNDRARLTVGVENANGSPTELAVFSATGETTVAINRPFRRITLKVNDAVVCTVEMSDPGTFADPTDGNEYYRCAVLKDAEGNTALEITDAKLAVNARIAIAARNSQCYISDISAYSENDVKVETQPPSEDTAPEEVTTETPVETTGEATEEATTEAPTESDGEESTAGESVTATDTPSAETDTQDRESPSDGGGIDVILLVIFGALEVVLMVVLTVLVKKRKGSAA